MLLNIRGTHGSGKTYISHKLIDDFPSRGVVEPQEVLGKRFVKNNCHIVGQHEDLNIVGRWKSGMDGIFPQEIIEEMIEHWAPRGHIIWENIVVSANIGRWATLAKKLEPINHSIWLFMDTPLQVCIDRVFARRAQAAAEGFNHRQLDSEVKLDVIAGHWRRVRRAAARAVLEGIEVRWVDHTCSYEQVYNLLVGEGSWRPTNVGFQTYHVKPLEPWRPTSDELEYVLKTSKLPWGDPDEMTKVDFVSTRTPIKRNRVVVASRDEFGIPVSRWGGEPDSEPEVEPVRVVREVQDIFSVAVNKWPGDTITDGSQSTKGEVE